MQEPCRRTSALKVCRRTASAWEHLFVNRGSSQVRPCRELRTTAVRPRRPLMRSPPTPATDGRDGGTRRRLWFCEGNIGDDGVRPCARCHVEHLQCRNRSREVAGCPLPIGGTRLKVSVLLFQFGGLLVKCYLDRGTKDSTVSHLSLITPHLSKPNRFTVIPRMSTEVLLHEVAHHLWGAAALAHGTEFVGVR